MANPVVVLISAQAEWRALLERLPGVALQASPYGKWFEQSPTGVKAPVVVFHGGFGKIAAAGSTQYAIDRWDPSLLVNLGTCGGFEGEIEHGAILLVERTVVYDLIEQISAPDAALSHYSTQLDLSWLREPFPLPVRRSLMVSGDRDLVAAEIPELKRRFGAVAGDWESGAIAYVAKRNARRLLILRGVTDLVGGSGGEAYGNAEMYRQAAREIMPRLWESLPAWLHCVEQT